MRLLKDDSTMMVVMWAPETVVRPKPVVEATTPATRWRIGPGARRRASRPDIRSKSRTEPRTAWTEPWPSRTESWTSRTVAWTTPAWASHRRWSTRSSRTAWSAWSAWSLGETNLYYNNKYYIPILEIQKMLQKFKLLQKWLY